MRAVC